MSDSMDRLDERLANWGRWLTSRRATYGQCFSIEGDYRSKGSKSYHPPGPRPIEARAADAWDLELTIATLVTRLHLVLELKHAFCLEDKRVAEYIRRAFKDRTKADDIEAIEWEAKCELAQALGEPLAIRRTRAVTRARAIIAKVQDMMVD